MITVINSPIGHKLTDESVSGSVTNNGGEALVTTSFTHGLSTGDYIYVSSDLESLSGFKYVVAYGSNSFKLKESIDGDVSEYFQNTTITYRIVVFSHGYLAAHQPIVYELASSLWPVNEDEGLYSPNTVSSFANSNGYTEITLDDPLTDPTALSWVSINLIPYQILSVVSSSVVVINLGYDAGNDLSGPVTRYYNNYAINVNVYVGLVTPHRWYLQKPYAILSTLRLIPGADGRVKFSISDIVRSYINTRNNLLLNTLPNNLDFFTGFYISYFESYDVSDGENVSTYNATVVTDFHDFEGHAVNASMPFKSLYNSHMSEYLNYDVYLADWLCLQTRPIAVIDRWFDISFINQLNTVDIKININKQLNGIVTAVETLTYTNPGAGVLRVGFTPTAGYDLYCIYAYTSGVAAVPPPTPPTMQALTSWANQPGAHPWSVGSEWVTSVNGSGGTSDYIRGTMATLAGIAHSFSMNINIGNTGSSIPLSTIRVAVLDNTYAELAYQDFIYSTYGTKAEDFIITPPTAGTYVGVKVFNNTPFDTKNYILIDFDFVGLSGADAGGSPAIPAQVITETICIDVIDDCSNTFVDDGSDRDARRLLEDGPFRLLE